MNESNLTLIVRGVVGQQSLFATQYISVSENMYKFVGNIVLALGEISREEAVEAIKKIFNEEMDKLK